MKRLLKTYSSKRFTSVFVLCLMLCMVFYMVSPSVVYASAVSTAQARVNLTSHVQSKMSDKLYTLEGGGSVKGSALFTGSPSNGYDLSEAEFSKLTSSAQKEVVNDIATYSNEAVETKKGVSDQTVQNWWKELQQKNGVGSKFLNTILADTKPDFVAANAIWKPFSGPVGIVMGVFAVALMGFLGIVMVSDIAYITLPPVRLFVSDDENGEKVAKSKIFSYDAIYAVQKAEADSDSGTPKQALGIYFKRRIFMLILLGICLLYLVQGQLWIFVGWVLDLFNGVLGF